MGDAILNQSVNTILIPGLLSSHFLRFLLGIVGER
jgi:hypothetical protein